MVVNPINPPDPPDIHSLIEQLGSAVEQGPEVADWLWHGMAVWAVGKSIEWAWKHREKLLRSTPPTQTIHAGYSPSEEQSFGATVVELVGSVTARSSVTGTLTVGSERQALWNVEASTLPERLLDVGIELVSWYLRQR